MRMVWSECLKSRPPGRLFVLGGIMWRCPLCHESVEAREQPTCLSCFEPMRRVREAPTLLETSRIPRRLMGLDRLMREIPHAH